MNIYIRRLLLFVSYTTFVVIAPLVILYAIGYRPQASSPIPRPVGVILADAFPKRAIITVNDKQYGTLPRSVPNIEPGIAKVTVAKEGYTPWEKLLPIKPVQATDIRSIRLLPSVFDTETILQGVKQFAVSPNNLLIAAITSKHMLSILDETGTKLFPEEQLTGQASAISWSPSGTHILISHAKNTHELFRVSDTSLTKIPIQELTGATNIIWSPVASNTLYALDKNKSVISYNVQSGTKEISIKNVAAYEIINRAIIYHTFQNQLILRQIRSGDEKILVENTEKTIKKIAGNSSGDIALLFADGELAIQTTNGGLMKVSSFAEHMSWSPDGQLLLVQTSPTELGIVNVENERLFALPQGELTLLTRLSQPIFNPQWFSDSLHIFYHLNDELFFSEIDTRDHPIAISIDTKTLVPLAITNQSKSIAYIRREGAEPRLVQTWLVTKEDR